MVREIPVIIILPCGAADYYRRKAAGLVVKLGQHSCTTVATLWLQVANYLQRLYGIYNALMQRNHIQYEGTLVHYTALIGFINYNINYCRTK